MHYRYTHYSTITLYSVQLHTILKRYNYIYMITYMYLNMYINLHKLYWYNGHVKLSLIPIPSQVLKKNSILTHALRPSAWHGTDRQMIKNKE